MRARHLRSIVRSVALMMPALAACGGAVASIGDSQGQGQSPVPAVGGETNSSKGSSASTGFSDPPKDAGASDAPYDAPKDVVVKDVVQDVVEECPGMCGCYVPETKTTTMDAVDGASCWEVCPQTAYGDVGYQLWFGGCTEADGMITCEYHGPPCGRRPAGWDPDPWVSGWFAKCAELEAVSIDAFAMLEEELGAHGAPRSLRMRARKAKADEVRHTQLMTRLARRAGEKVARRRKAPKRAVRAAEDMAIENAVEGCVREAYGALLAMWQAEHARDARVKEAMKEIAADETEHAVLAWDVQRWLSSRLDARAQRRIERAMTRALDTLAREVQATPLENADALGLPDRRASAALVEGLAAAIRSAN